MTTEQKIELIRQRRRAMKASGIRLPRRKKIPRQLFPSAIIMSYYKDIINMLEPMFSGVKNILIPQLPYIVQQYQEEMRLDTYGEIIYTSFCEVRAGLARVMTDPALRELGNQYAVRTNAFNAQQVDRQFKTVLGISVLQDESWLRPKMEAFTQHNIQLIKSIPEEYLNSLETMVRTSVERGVSTKSLTKQILSDMEIKPSEPTIRGIRKINPKARARLIARDQIGKFNSGLTKARQTNIGIEDYIWATSGDGRVRDEHAAIDGNRYSWKTGAPELGGLNPGEDYQCRCSAIPVMDKFFEAEETIPRAA